MIILPPSFLAVNLDGLVKIRIPDDKKRRFQGTRFPGNEADLSYIGMIKDEDQY
jgi:hypothetical protein